MTGRRLSGFSGAGRHSRGRQEPRKAAAWPRLSRWQTPDPHRAPSQTVPALQDGNCIQKRPKPVIFGPSAMRTVSAGAGAAPVAGGTAQASSAEMMDTTVRTVSMVCTLMIVLSRCFYTHLAFACGNETHHGGGGSDNGNGAGGCNRNRAGAKKVVKTRKKGLHGTQHKGGL